MPLSSRNTIRHASIFVLVLLVSCVIAQNGSPTLFGLHNNISNSQTASNAMNAWMQGPHTKDMQSFIGVQAVSFYLFT
ncbi:membrane-associated protein, putative, partial [Bodo saltans]